MNLKWFLIPLGAAAMAAVPRPCDESPGAVRVSRVQWDVAVTADLGFDASRYDVDVAAVLLDDTVVEETPRSVRKDEGPVCSVKGAEGVWCSVGNPDEPAFPFCSVWGNSESMKFCSVQGGSFNICSVLGGDPPYERNCSIDFGAGPFCSVDGGTANSCSALPDSGDEGGMRCSVLYAQDSNQCSVNAGATNSACSVFGGDGSGAGRCSTFGGGECSVEPNGGGGDRNYCTAAPGDGGAAVCSAHDGGGHCSVIGGPPLTPPDTYCYSGPP